LVFPKMRLVTGMDSSLIQRAHHDALRRGHTSGGMLSWNLCVDFETGFALERLLPAEGFIEPELDRHGEFPVRLTFETRRPLIS
jgi:hypothetical protein